MRKKRRKGLDLELDLKGERRKSKMAIMYEVMFWVFGTLAAIFLGIMTVNFVGIKTSVIGSSMEPSLHNG